MFASLTLLMGFGIMSGIPAADQVICPVSHHGALPIPTLWYAPGRPFGVGSETKPTITTATDAIDVPLPGASWFQEYVGGASNGVYALYDTTTGTYFQCGYEDTARFFGAWKVPLSWVPRAVPARAAAISVRTARGVAFGMTPAQVQAVYGKAPLQSFIYGASLIYEKHRQVGRNDFVTGTTFYFSDGKLIGVEREAGF
jgi:hypothetical protein